MAYSYKTAINFGFVYIPVTLHNSLKNNDIGFNMIDKKTMSRVKYIKTCVDCGDRIVKQEDIVKGYEYEEGKYVIFDESDFDKLKSDKDKNITIEKFVNIAEVDPIYFDKPYYVAPTGAERAYKVLMTAMEEEGKAAIAKTVLGNKESLILIRAEKGELLLNTLFFADELQRNPAKEVNDIPDNKELNLAKMLIDNMSGDFNPQNYRDEYRAKVQQAIEEKIAGKEIVAPKPQQHGNAATLMEALEMSLKNGKTEEKSIDKNAKKPQSKESLKSADKPRRKFKK